MTHPDYKHIGHPIVRLIEEASEVIHIASKIQRFGWNTWYPEDPTETPNHTLIQSEMRDLVETWNELAEREGLKKLGWQP